MRRIKDSYDAADDAFDLLFQIRTDAVNIFYQAALNDYENKEFSIIVDAALAQEEGIDAAEAYERIYIQYANGKRKSLVEFSVSELVDLLDAISYYG